MLAKPKVVAFDTFFTEEDKDRKESDMALAEAVGKSNNVVSAFFFNANLDESNIGIDPLFPYPALSEASQFIGFVNLVPDKDGVTRRAKLYAVVGESVYPYLAVATYAMSQGKGFDDIAPELPIVIGTNPNTSKNDLFINFTYPNKNTSYFEYSYVEVLEGKIDLQKAFSDKIVFIGATATSLFDLKATPYTNIYPGVFVHANVVDNLISRNYIREAETYWTVVSVILIGLVFGFFMPRLTPWAQLIMFLILMGGGLALSIWAFVSRNFLVHIVPPFLTGLGSYGGILFYRLVIEEREKRKIKGSFKQYLSHKIIDILTKDPNKLQLGGEEKEVTVFFLDIAGFTTMSETLSPQQLVEVMNQCLTRFSDIILEHDGLINKYIGDCIMAFWNAPADQPKHASLACRAALKCIEAVPGLNKAFAAKGLPNIDCRVGINTGLVVVGNMGSKDRFDYTVMGDAVNLASRLEGANKEYHTHIMISQETFEKAQEDIEARDLDLIRVKGKKEPKKVFELLCEKGRMSPELEKGRQVYHDALRFYRHKQFHEAMVAFKKVFNHLPNDHLANTYLERLTRFGLTPPNQDWDGVFEMKTK